MGEEKCWWSTEGPVTQGRFDSQEKRRDGLERKKSYLGEGQSLSKLGGNECKLVTNTEAGS